MRFSATEILNIADVNGFDAMVVEKVLHLLHLYIQLPPNRLVALLHGIAAPRNGGWLPVALHSLSSGALSRALRRSCLSLTIPVHTHKPRLAYAPANHVLFVL